MAGWNIQRDRDRGSHCLRDDDAWSAISVENFDRALIHVGDDNLKRDDGRPALPQGAKGNIIGNVEAQAGLLTDREQAVPNDAIDEGGDARGREVPVTPRRQSHATHHPRGEKEVRERAHKDTCKERAFAVAKNPLKPLPIPFAEQFDRRRPVAC